MSLLSDLAERYRHLAEKTGKKGGSSYAVGFTIHQNGQISVGIGTFDIPKMQRWTDVGTFDTESKALEALRIKIEECERLVDDNPGPQPHKPTQPGVNEEGWP